MSHSKGGYEKAHYSYHCYVNSFFYMQYISFLLIGWIVIFSKLFMYCLFISILFIGFYRYLYPIFVNYYPKSCTWVLCVFFTSYLGIYKIVSINLMFLAYFINDKIRSKQVSYSFQQTHNAALSAIEHKILLWIIVVIINTNNPYLIFTLFPRMKHPFKRRGWSLIHPKQQIRGSLIEVITKSNHIEFYLLTHSNYPPFHHHSTSLPFIQLDAITLCFH